ncbi:MAG: hypothetical protein P8X80_09045 [Desulfobacterales bacterium]
MTKKIKGHPTATALKTNFALAIPIFKFETLILDLTSLCKTLPFITSRCSSAAYRLHLFSSLTGDSYEPPFFTASSRTAIFPGSYSTRPFFTNQFLRVNLAIASMLNPSLSIFFF